MRPFPVGLAACVALLVAAISCAPGPHNPDKHYTHSLLPSSNTVDTPEVILFIVDGVNADIFQEMLEAGELPNIQTYFVDRGIYIPRATTVTPSITYPCLTSLVTARTPGDHGILGINWFDRNQLIWRDYHTIAQKNTLDGDYIAPTIFEQFPNRSTYAVSLQPHRGATKFFENAWSNASAYAFSMWDQMDRTTLSRMGEVSQLARERGEWPAFTVFYLMSPDFNAYSHGLESDQYRKSLVHTDTQLGATLKMLDDAGVLDSVIIALTSDHGMVQVNRHFALEDFLRDEMGLEVAPQKLWEKTTFETRLKTYRRYNTVLNCSGNRYAAIQLRAPGRVVEGEQQFESWPTRPTDSDLYKYPTREGGTSDLPKTLVAEEAIAAVAWGDSHSVRLRTDAGLVEFAGDPYTGTIGYTCLEGDDPLGWEGKVDATLLNGSMTAERTWQEQTAGLDYADFPTQLMDYFGARRAGDLVVFADGDWDFRQTNRAGHGGIAAAELHVPVLIAGRDITPQTVDIHPRSIDLPVTLLRLMGETEVATPDAAIIIDALPAYMRDDNE
jgi:hypothetical protein